MGWGFLTPDEVDQSRCDSEVASNPTIYARDGVVAEADCTEAASEQVRVDGGRDGFGSVGGMGGVDGCSSLVDDRLLSSTTCLIGDEVVRCRWSRSTINSLRIRAGVHVLEEQAEDEGIDVWEADRELWDRDWLGLGLVARICSVGREFALLVGVVGDNAIVLGHEAIDLVAERDRVGAEEVQGEGVLAREGAGTDNDGYGWALDPGGG